MERSVFLAINHGANRDAYGGLDYIMLLSAYTHRIDVTCVLAHSTIASFFFSFSLTRQYLQQSKLGLQGTLCKYATASVDTPPRNADLAGTHDAEKK